MIIQQKSVIHYLFIRLLLGRDRSGRALLTAASCECLSTSSWWRQDARTSVICGTVAAGVRVLRQRATVRPPCRPHPQSWCPASQDWTTPSVAASSTCLGAVWSHLLIFFNLQLDTAAKFL